MLLWGRHQLGVSVETVRRWLHRGEMVDRRPRPTVGPRDLYEHRDRIELDMLPKYSPDANPMERIWWLVREHVTRNHWRRNSQESTGIVMEYLESEG